MSHDQPILRHNGVGIADMYSPEEYERLMAGNEVPNQTDVLTNQTDVLTNSQPQDRGLRVKSATLSDLFFQGYYGLVLHFKLFKEYNIKEYNIV